MSAEILPQIHIPGVSSEPADITNVQPPSLTIHHVFIIDKSGSMATARNATVTGINEQIQNIKQLAVQFPGQQHLTTLVLFNGRSEIKFFDLGVADLHEITTEDYVPNGATALYSTVGEVATSVFQSLSTSGRLATDRVVITVMTDGDNTENSPTWSQSKLKEYLQQMQSDHGWVVAYIGADISVEAVQETAQAMGIGSANSMAYTAGSISSARGAFRETARSMSAFCQNSAAGTPSTGGYFFSRDLRDSAAPNATNVLTPDEIAARGRRAAT